MPTKADFLALEPEMRSYAIVGHFLKKWSELESSMGYAIELAFGLTGVQGAVFLGNMDVVSKINTLKTIASECFDENDPNEKLKLGHAVGVLNKAMKFAETRNVVAHQVFHYDHNGDGVVFVGVRVRSKLTFQELIWSVDEALKVASELEECRINVDKMSESLQAFTEWRNALTVAIAKQREEG